MRNKLCSVDFITLWDDGVISVDDGVGYTGELCTMETMELYQALRKFFEEENGSLHNKQSKPCFFENEHKRYKREYLAYCAHCGIKL